MIFNEIIITKFKCKYKLYEIIRKCKVIKKLEKVFAWGIADNGVLGINDKGKINNPVLVSFPNYIEIVY